MTESTTFRRERLNDESSILFGDIVQRAVNDNHSMTVCAFRHGSVILSFDAPGIGINRHLSAAEARAIGNELIAAANAIAPEKEPA